MKAKIIKQNLTTKKAGLSYLQILILVTATFAFAYLIYFSTRIVSAQTERVQCCEETNDGYICQEFLAENIEDNCKGTIFPGQCKDFDNCKLGCCYDSKEGTCSANSPKKSCNGIWKEEASCNLPECQMACCILGSEARFTTEQRCKKLSGFYGLQADFRQDIDNELECLFFTERDDEGACVFESDLEKTCKFTTRDNCRKINGDFYKDVFCSDSALITNCIEKDYVGCVEGEDSVYWFDSCGNREEIKEKCSFFEGTICGLEDGEYKCRSIDCNIDGKIRKNGESWCVYDGTIGKGRDVAGSRHMKHTCFMGKEIIELCADYRNEICVQTDTKLATGVFSEAACRINRWRECTEINLEEDAERKKERCEKNVDCEFKQVNIDKHFSFPVCTPYYPPGFDLKNRPDDANLICAQATQKCIAVKVKKLSGWKWVANKECTKMSFTEKMNDYCRSLGDCGGYVNIVGGYDQGFNVKGKSPHSISQSKISEYKSYARPKPGQKPAEPGDFSDVAYTSIEYSEEETSVPGGWIGIGSIVGGVGAITFAKTWGAKMIGLKIGEWKIGGGISKIAGKFPKTATVTEGGKVTAGWTGFKNVISGSLGAAAGTYVMMKLAGGGLPSDAAAVVSITSSILGAVAGASAAAGTTVLTLEAAQAAASTAFKSFATTAAEAWLAAEGAADIEAVEAAAAELQTATANLKAVQDGQTVYVTPTNPFITGLVHAFIWAVIIAAILIGIMKLLGIGKTKKYVIEFHCLPWQPPTGGADCDKCNGNLFKPCSDYRCHSLGQTCELINKGTEHELCVDNSPTDVSSPRISPLYDAITEGYQYYNIKDKGFEVVNSKDKGCIPEFTTVVFGIETNKPAQCKIGTSVLQTYDDMGEFFGGSNLYTTNHTTIFSMPSQESLENYDNLTELKITNVGEINFYVKCKSVNGAVNEAAYVIKSCVKPGPDLTAPYVTKAEPLSGSYVKYNATEQALSLWTNEPANCRWSIEDKAYEDMGNQMSCEYDLNDRNLYGWTCNTTLKDINEKGIAFIAYIKCQDISENKNTMTESYPYGLIISSSELIIEEIKPVDGEEIVAGVEPMTLNLEVVTSGGAEDGKADCYYKFREENDYIQFYDTFSSLHKQVFSSIMSGSYKIYIKCQDVAGNIAENSTEFKVEVDTRAPKITRVYYDGTLKLITNEDAVCAYSFTDSKCRFDIENATQAGLMSGESKEHSADWQTDSTYFIKCKDEYGNEQGRCSIVIRPYDIA